jgi:hypothetical protein
MEDDSSTYSWTDALLGSVGVNISFDAGRDSYNSLELRVAGIYRLRHACLTVWIGLKVVCFPFGSLRSTTGSDRF